MSYKRSEKPTLKPMTIRLSADAWDSIEKIAKEHGMNKTELVRMALAGNLARYLGSIRIIDEERATEIRELIRALLDEISAVKMNLHRIGVNFNTEVKLKAIERKYANSGSSYETINAKWNEEQKAKSECRGFSKDDMEALISRYEKATSEVGEILCRILT